MSYIFINNQYSTIIIKDSGVKKLKQVSFISYHSLKNYLRRTSRAGQWSFHHEMWWENANLIYSTMGTPRTLESITNNS